MRPWSRWHSWSARLTPLPWPAHPPRARTLQVGRQEEDCACCWAANRRRSLQDASRPNGMGPTAHPLPRAACSVPPAKGAAPLPPCAAAGDPEHPLPAWPMQAVCAEMEGELSGDEELLGVRGLVISSSATGRVAEEALQRCASVLGSQLQCMHRPAPDCPLQCWGPCFLPDGPHPAALPAHCHPGAWPRCSRGHQCDAGRDLLHKGGNLLDGHAGVRVRMGAAQSACMQLAIRQASTHCLVHVRSATPNHVVSSIHHQCCTAQPADIVSLLGLGILVPSVQPGVCV